MSTASLQTSSTVTAQNLIDFEAEIAELFEAGKIPYPVHFSGGNESQLLDLFTQVDKENDYICGTWRFHLHCLLHGVPPAEVKAAIMAGRSIALCFPKYRVIASALVGGIAPIAVGIALSLKKQEKPGKVWCFLGDMAVTAGIVSECIRYSAGHDLPINFVVENNGMSVMTHTQEVWGAGTTIPIRGYQYKLTWPHVSTGRWVSF
jgi:TPP-dependent pyruvate/acetoin dehydrogenase alpha subunit